MTAGAAAPDSRAAPSKTLLLVAFATVYVVWGSTYLAIRIAVEHWPPLWLASVRFAIAGGGLYAVLRLRGAPAPGWRAWLAATVVGGLMLAGGNGTVCWAEQWVPSGETALILAAAPLWTILLPWLFRRARAPRPLVALGVVIGLVGVGVLIGGPDHATAVTRVATGGRALLWARLSLLGASLSWVVGSLIQHRLPLPKSAALATAMEMVVACPILALAALAHGDLTNFHFAEIPADRVGGARIPGRVRKPGRLRLLRVRPDSRGADARVDGRVRQPADRRRPGRGAGGRADGRAHGDRGGDDHRRGRGRHPGHGASVNVFPGFPPVDFPGNLA